VRAFRRSVGHPGLSTRDAVVRREEDAVSARGQL
jgi:hypothetical protein